jgi:hypothetical protein
MKEPPKKKSARSPKPPNPASNKMLTMKLRELSKDIISSNLVDGEVVMLTRAELLAEEIWDAACGVVHDKDGRTFLSHNPVPWAVATVLERLEGKVVPRAKDTTNRPTLGKRIEEQQKLKMDNLKHD